nr:ANTAR domain-containing protein [Nakamurella flavida]
MGATARAVGVRAVTAFPLRAGAIPAAALNLYCTSESASARLDVHLPTVLVEYLQRGLADFVAANPQKTSHVQLLQAIYAQTVIGRAQGVVMVRSAVDKDRALDELTQRARQRRLPLWRYADEVVNTVPD